jgi:SAM-dependent methyltransferase
VNFGEIYARAYDALYRDKNYAKEVGFVLNQIHTVIPEAPIRILDLGCGTGLHAVQLAEAGISVTGIDLSAAMIATAEKHKGSLSRAARDLLHFKIGDIRAIDLNREYDAVISLFHVISYVTQDDDLEATFRQVRRHLTGGGVFIFDFWYGPAVLHDPPRRRVRTIQMGDDYIERMSSPEWDQRRSVVCVNYDIKVTNLVSGETTREREQHVIRYFFPRQLESKLTTSGFEVEHFGEWLTGNPPSDSTFGVYVVARAK